MQVINKSTTIALLTLLSHTSAAPANPSLSTHLTLQKRSVQDYIEPYITSSTNIFSAVVPRLTARMNPPPYWLGYAMIGALGHGQDPSQASKEKSCMLKCQSFCTSDQTGLCAPKCEKYETAKDICVGLH